MVAQYTVSNSVPPLRQKFATSFTTEPEHTPCMLHVSVSVDNGVGAEVMRWNLHLFDVDRGGSWAS